MADFVRFYKIPVRKRIYLYLFIIFSALFSSFTSGLFTGIIFLYFNNTNLRERKQDMLTISLQTDCKSPLYEQIYAHIKKEITENNLTEGEKLPSSRNLAQHLGVSRNTINLAYDQLVSEGYLESRNKSGYYVCNIKPLQKMQNKKHKDTLPTQREPAAPSPYCFDFSPFAIDLSNFPFSTWRKLSKECMVDIRQDLFLLGDNQGELHLRQAIAKYLHDARGVHCQADQIIIGAGMGYLLQLLTVLLPQKSPLAIENPAYMQAYSIFSSAGFPILPVPVTTHGIATEYLKTTEAVYAYVTPSHQYPLGSVLGATGRHALLSWAAEKEERYIIEDDHDSEFRYKGKPIPSLQGLDTSESVIYLGTFSRSIAPAIRVAYMVLPPRLLTHYRTHCSFYSNTVSRIDQNILSNFIDGGYFERHLNKMRKIYHAKHDSMVQELAVFGNKIRISDSNAGLHLLIEFKLPFSEEELIAAAKQAGIRIYGLSPHEIIPVARKYPVCLMGFANLTPEEIKHGIQQLYSALSIYF